MRNNVRTYSGFRHRNVLAVAIVAASYAHAGEKLEEVIVTAQRNETSLQQTPMTVSVESGQKLHDYSVISFADIARITPGVTISNDSSNAKDIAIRGLGTGHRTSSNDDRVAVYYDGGYTSSIFIFAASQFDLDRYEILRGPQGTLYGRTSPNGSIVIHTANPNLTKVDGYVEGTLADHNTGNGQFGISIPLIENELGVRIAGFYSEDGSSGVRDKLLGTDALTRSNGMRATVYWEPNSEFNARLSSTYSHSFGNRFIASEGTSITAYPNFQTKTLDYKDRTTYANTVPAFDNYTTLSSLEVNWDTGPVTVSALTFLQTVHETSTDDNDNSALPERYTTTESHLPATFQQELRISSNNADFWDYMVGANWGYTRNNTPFSSYLDATITHNNPNIFANAKLDTDDRGIFSHNTFHFTDSFDVTLGVRYSDQWRLSREAFVLEGNGNSPVDIVGVPKSDERSSYHTLTGVASAQYQFSPDTMSYVSYNRALRGGSANISTTPFTPELATFKPEKIDAFELGYKTTFADGRARWNSAVFYQIYKDFQYAATFTYSGGPYDSGRSAQATTNVDKVVSKGFETDLTLMPIENWTTDFALTVADVKFKNALAVPCDDGSAPTVTSGGSSYHTCDMSGQAVGGQPRLSTTVTSEYSIPFGSYEWYLRALYKFDSYRDNPELPERFGGFGVADFYSGVRSPEQHWDVRAWVKNAFDRFAVVRSYPNDLTSSQLGLKDFTATPPRQVGVTGTYHF